jgi:hypothetical protein
MKIDFGIETVIKGLALFAWAILAILALVSGWIGNATFFGICGTLYFALNGYMIYRYFRKWSIEYRYFRKWSIETKDK